jgi:hypothetical protein
MSPHLGCLIAGITCTAVASFFAYSAGAGEDRPKYEEFSSNEVSWSGNDERDYAKPTITDRLRQEVLTEGERHDAILVKLSKKFSPKQVDKLVPLLSIIHLKNLLDILERSVLISVNVTHNVGWTKALRNIRTELRSIVDYQQNFPTEACRRAYKMLKNASKNKNSNIFSDLDGAIIGTTFIEAANRAQTGLEVIKDEKSRSNLQQIIFNECSRAIVRQVITSIGSVGAPFVLGVLGL